MHLQVQAADILHNVQAGVAYEDIVWGGGYGYHQLETAYQSKSKGMTQLISKFLYFKATAKQLDHWALTQGLHLEDSSLCIH
jgi:hypothetical protein